MSDVGIVIGSVNRLVLLQACVDSIRRAVGTLDYSIMAVDCSTDGSTEWLANQDDVTLIAGDMSGATRNYNRGFARCVEYDFDFCAILNDDDEVVTPGAIVSAIDMMKADESIGAVAFQTDLRGEGWACECWRTLPSCGKGVVRRDALMAVARAQGDPSGKKFWSEEWATYAADSQAGILIHKLGWLVAAGIGLHVHDNAPNSIGGDALRTRNTLEYVNGPGPALFTSRWASARCADYDAEMAARFGGRIL
jgi:GT2 family glycosyltransferase